MSAFNTSLIKLYPIVLSGGSGTRLWPLSRSSYPKQFLRLLSGHSLLQETALRLQNMDFVKNPIIVASQDHRFIVGDQLSEIGCDTSAIFLEPFGRNTAPAVTIAALWLYEKHPDAFMAVFPADHIISDKEHFQKDLKKAVETAQQDRLVTFGLEPARPETGYGYIEKADALKGVDGAFGVKQFVEKPNEKRAREMIEQGGYYWNSGMFVMPVERYIKEVQRYAPEVYATCQKAYLESEADLDFIRIGEASFKQCPSISIDHAIMEKSRDVAVVTSSMPWSDVGAWQALWEIQDKDQAGNVIRGQVISNDVEGSILQSEGKKVLAAIGVKDMIVVSTQDAVLVAPRARSADISKLLAQVKEESHWQATDFQKVHRPWGYYEDLDEDAAFRVKRIVVKPGSRLSLQRHQHRSEHWVVVSGVATVTRGEEITELTANQSTYIPAKEVHRLENLGDEPLHLIEVQCGSYLGEDDIERLSDDYGRKKAAE